MSEPSQGNAGPATDRHNEPVVDPTANVIALNAAQDLLRDMESKHVREILDLRSNTAEKIAALEQSLIEEKFRSVQQVQILTENHRLELKGDGEKQLTAALAAAEKAVGEQNKSNTLSTDRAVTGMEKSITNNAEIAKATTSALTDKVEDLKSQVAILVNQRIGANDQKQEQRAISGGMVALVAVGSGILFSVITLMITLLIR